MTTEALGSRPATATEAPWVPDDSTLGARLALVRWRMGWNVKEAALACNVPAASWRTWEMDGAQPRNIVEIAQKISMRTGCDRIWLLTGEQAVKPSAWKERLPDRPTDNRPNGRPRERGTSTSRPARRVAPVDPAGAAIVRPQRIVKRAAVAPACG